MAFEETEYQELLRDAKARVFLPSLADYNTWLKDCIQKSFDCGRPVKVYKGTAIGVMAFLWASKRELDVAALLAYAYHLMRQESRND